MRATRAEPGCGEFVCAEVGWVDWVCNEAVDAGANALPTAGTVGVAIERDEEAIWPSCVIPVGVVAVGAALALTSVSCPLEPTRDSSAVFVCSVVVVWASVVSTG